MHTLWPEKARVFHQTQVVVEYDEEIPYDQDLAIRYSPFPIHQLCILVAPKDALKLIALPDGIGGT